MKSSNQDIDLLNAFSGLHYPPPHYVDIGDIFRSSACENDDIYGEDFALNAECFGRDPRTDNKRHFLAASALQKSRADEPQAATTPGSDFPIDAAPPREAVL